MPLVSQEMIEAVFDYLNDQCDAAAQAKADLIIAEFRRKKKFSELKLKSLETTVAMKDAWAESHPEYEKAWLYEAECEKAVEWHKRQQMRADAITSAWQTESANRRNISRVA